MYQKNRVAEAFRSSGISLGSKIKPVPINHLVVARPTEFRKRKPVTCQIEYVIKKP